jgi:hypothetical protein
MIVEFALGSFVHLDFEQVTLVTGLHFVNIVYCAPKLGQNVSDFVEDVLQVADLALG